MKTPEGKLKDQIKYILRERKAYFFMPVPTGYGSPTLDFIGCWRGLFFAIETKAPGKDPTPRQYAAMYSMTQAGARVWCGSDINKFRDWLNVWCSP